MFNCVKRDDIDCSPYEEGEWRFIYLRIGGCIKCRLKRSSDNTIHYIVLCARH
ncbi:hypothetical protein RchiOBHm_Chr7g0199471 [Rosa chinensis]|uniref:Uncharacterized protein n=1 Tax=Rosa chinensis TaxID=74649 RepID=A0A2P6P7E7_ROSCH|nr:hypothetical protein RchiOBHm_Chr7g0199471 [Rosa chinensis]